MTDKTMSPEDVVARPRSGTRPASAAPPGRPGRRWSARAWRRATATATARTCPGQALLAANTPMLLKASLVEGRTDLGVMASGQVAGAIEDLPSREELVTRIVSEAAHVLRTLPSP